MNQLITFLIILQHSFFQPNNDLIYLSKVINSECGICDIREMRLVGSVVLNRVESYKFPNSIEGVIFQPNQFHGVETPHFRDTPRTRRVAKELLENKNRSKSVLYFVNPNLSNNKRFIIFVMSSDHFIECKFHIFG